MRLQNRESSSSVRPRKRATRRCSYYHGTRGAAQLQFPKEKALLRGLSHRRIRTGDLSVPRQQAATRCNELKLTANDPCAYGNPRAVVPTLIAMHHPLLVTRVRPGTNSCSAGMAPRSRASAVSADANGGEGADPVVEQRNAPPRSFRPWRPRALRRHHQPSSRMSPRPMKNSPAALSSPTVNTRPRRAICSRTAASPRWLGPGHPGQGEGHPRRHGNQADEHEDEHRDSCDLSVSPGDLSGGRCDQGQRRDVSRHGEHAKRKRRPSLARITRTPAVVPALAARRPAPAPSQDENENSHGDQDQAENEVERRVEVRLGRERDRASEQHDGDDDHERGEDDAGGVACPCPTTVGAGEEHGLFRQHNGADRSA